VQQKYTCQLIGKQLTKHGEGVYFKDLDIVNFVEVFLDLCFCHGRGYLELGLGWNCRGGQRHQTHIHVRKPHFDHFVFKFAERILDFNGKLLISGD
jgi:hypothetical protein